MKRQSIYQNNLYNTNDTADLGLYGPQWKAKKISFWMCTVPDGAQWTRVEGIVQLIPTMKSLDGVNKKNDVNNTASEAPEKNVKTESEKIDFSNVKIATVYKGNIIKNLIMDCQSYTKYRPNETTGGIFVSWRRKEELPTGA